MIGRNQGSDDLRVLSGQTIRAILVAVVLLAVAMLSTVRTDHFLSDDGSQSYERSILGIVIEHWTERGEFECQAHLDYARAKSAPLLLSSCFLVFGCTRYEPAFYEAGCQG